MGAAIKVGDFVRDWFADDVFIEAIELEGFFGKQGEALERAFADGKWKSVDIIFLRALGHVYKMIVHERDFGSAYTKESDFRVHAQFLALVREEIAIALGYHLECELSDPVQWHDYDFMKDAWNDLHSIEERLAVALSSRAM